MHVLDIIMNLFYPDHPNSLGIGSSNSQQHGKRINMKANIQILIFRKR